MSSILNESQISLPELAAEIDRDPTTTWRWSKYGVHGVVLESILIGGRRVTSRESYDRFLVRLNNKPVETKNRERQIRDAEAAVAKFGV